MTMPSTPFVLGILFLAWCVNNARSEKVLNVSTGYTVLLGPDVEEPSIISVTWKHEADLAAEWFGGSVTFYRSFNGRCSLNTTTGEMMINDLRLEDGGVYTPEINNNVRAAVTLRVFSPVPKPNITHDCKPKQTKCTLTCTFDRTKDMGGVEVFWIRENRVEKGDGALEITEETKEKTFICSLKNSVSSENSTELQNPLLTDGKSGRTHIAVGIVLGVLAFCAVFLFLLYKKLPIIKRFFNKREETSTDEEQENLTEDLWPNGTEGILKTGSLTTKTSTEETNPFLSENEKCNPESSVTVTAEINSQNDPNTTNTQEPDQNPDPALSLETKPDPETNTTNRPEPDESPDPAPSSETRPDPAAGGDEAPPEETRPNQEFEVTVTAEINHQNDPNTTNTQEPDQNPDPASSLETKPDPETNTTNRPEPDENPDPAPSSETRPDPEETRPNQETRVTVTAEINHQNESNPQEPDLEPATTPFIGTTQEPNTKTDEDPENLNKDPSEEVNHETGSGSAENDPPETERAEASSGSPDGGVSTSEPSCEQ